MTLVGIITLLIVGITLLITPIIPTLIYLLAGKNVFQFCGLFTIIGGVGLLFAPANILRLVLLTRAIKGVGASLPDLHQVPAERQEVQEIRDETEARKLETIAAHHERPEDFITPDIKV